MAAQAEEAVEYERADAELMLAPDVEARPWAEQLALDDASYREQLAYLFERSAFYREKLAAAGIASAEAAGGLAEIAQLPLTEKHELKATRTPRTRSARTSARPRRDRPHLLDERHDRHAELHPADRRRSRQLGRPARRGATPPPASRPGERIVSTYNAGPFVAGAALAAFDRIGALPHPGRHRATPSG